MLNFRKIKNKWIKRIKVLNELSPELNLPR